MTNKITLTAYEKKCASALAHAFYDYAPEWQCKLPPFKEVLAEAQELVHAENRCSDWRKRLRHPGTPIMPACGFDYVGVEYYLDRNDEKHFNNLRESLKACLRSTYDGYEQDKRDRDPVLQ